MTSNVNKVQCYIQLIARQGDCVSYSTAAVVFYALARTDFS